MNTANVVLNTRVMPESRRIFEGEDSDLSLLRRLSHIVRSSKSDIRTNRVSRAGCLDTRVGDYALVENREGALLGIADEMRISQ